METTGKISVSNLTSVPETMLVPLFFKAKETKEKGIITDNKAVEIVSRIDYDFSKMESDWRTQISLAIRTELFDEILAELSKKMGGKLAVVNLGAGLDTRQERFPNLKWYQLDLPQAIAIREQFFPSSNATIIIKSILDFSWLDEVKEKENVLFIAEGVLAYFHEEEVKSILKHISNHFSSSFIVFSSMHKWMIGRRPSKSVDPTKAPHKWGIRSINDVLDLKTGWKLYKQYFIFDYHKKRLKWLRWLGMLPALKKGFITAVLKTER